MGGDKAGTAVSSSVLPLTQLGHRGDHIPLVIPPWHREGNLISQGPGVTDLELAFSELRLRKVQLVLPEPCRCQGSEGTVQPGWQRWADTAVVQRRSPVSPVLPQGAAGSLSCAILPAWDLYIQPQLQELGPGLGTPPAALSSILSVSPELRGWLYPALLLCQLHSRVRVLLRDTQPCLCSLVMLKSQEDKVEQQSRAWGFQPAPCLPRRDQLPLVNVRYQRGSNSQIL